MKIIKKLAKWILRKELSQAQRRILESRKKILIPQSVLEKAISVLPAPNQAATGILSNHKIEYFDVNLGCRKRKISIQIKGFFNNDDDGSIGVVVFADGLDLELIFTLKIDNIGYHAYGIDSEVRTYYWEFDSLNISIISDKDFEVMAAFWAAQDSVIDEFMN